MQDATRERGGGNLYSSGMQGAGSRGEKAATHYWCHVTSEGKFIQCNMMQ